MTQSPRWTVEFYVDIRGHAPAHEFIEACQPKERAALARVIGLLERYGPLLHMPYARHIDADIWELRAGAGRLFYLSYIGRRFIILHGYRKKSAQAPREEIATAKRRREDFLRREQDAR